MANEPMKAALLVVLAALSACGGTVQTYSGDGGDIYFSPTYVQGDAGCSGAGMLGGLGGVCGEAVTCGPLRSFDGGPICCCH